MADGAGQRDVSGPDFNFTGRADRAGVSGPGRGDSVAAMAHVLAGGYHGPPPLTVARGFTQWTLDPWMLALVLLLGAAYLTGVLRGRGRGPGAAAPPWPWTRVANFGLGLAIVVIATMGDRKSVVEGKSVDLGGR